MKRGVLLFLAVFGTLLYLGNDKAMAASNLYANASAELGTATTATNWTGSKWGTLTASYSVQTSGAQDGARSLYVSVSSYKSGDAKWYPDATPVTPGATYQFSDWYKSNVATSIDAEVLLTNGNYQYLWLSGPAANATTWTQFTGSFTVPANAASVRVFHTLDKNGWLQTDNYSLSTGAVTPDPTPVPVPDPTPTPTPTTGPFTRGLVSIEFDDGWLSAYQYGLPLVESFGWKPTQYVITGTTGWAGYMTNSQIIDWNRRGDIGSHTVTHPHLPQLGTAKMTNELKNSKTYLDNLLGEPTKLFVTPYCESNTKVVTIAKTLYQDLRNCTEDVNSKANFNQYDIKSFIVLNTTTDAEINALLNKAKTTNSWLVLVWHEVAGDNKNSWSVSPTTLQRQLQLVKNSGITVVSSQQALNEELGL